jgi:hypothetical protein
MADTVTTETRETEFDDGSKMVETVTTASEFESGENAPIEAVELIDEIVGDAVTITAIEADASVDREQIRADAEVAIAEANAEARIEEAKALGNGGSDDEWQKSLELRLVAMETSLASIRQHLNPEPEPPILEANPPPESAADPGAAEPEAVAPEPPSRPKRSRWI